MIKTLPKDHTLFEMTALARSAGRTVMARYRTARVRSYKEDLSPLTQADLDANRIIERGLKRMSPLWPIVSEESPIPPYSERRKWSSFWLVDPIDGTREFLKKTGHFTVNIGLIRDGVPVAGVVFAPALNIMYFGSKTAGSWKIEGRHGLQAIYPKPLLPGETARVLVSRHHETETVIARLSRSRDIVCQKVGSSLKFGLVAEGRAHTYTRSGPTCEWDTAAGDAVWRYATATGGANPSPLKYNKADLKNPAFIIGWDPAHGDIKKK